MSRNATQEVTLKSLRLALGWSQKRLAHEVDVDVMTVSRWENEHQPVGTLVLKYLTLLCKTKKVHLVAPNF